MKRSSASIIIIAVITVTLREEHLLRARNAQEEFSRPLSYLSFIITP